MDCFSLRYLRYALLALIFVQGNADANALSCQAPAPQSQPLLPGDHVLACTPLDTTNYPPTSGTHFSDWANYQIYTQPVTAGYWLHSAEHGAVIFLYNCPSGCTEAVQTLTALIHSLPQDPLCMMISSSKLERRVILAPDRHLDSAFTLIAWGWSLKTNCLDTAAMHAFYTTHYAQAPENFCGAGVDSSASHWCNEPVLAIKQGPGNFSSRTSMPSPGILWEGSLAEQVQLSLELSTLAGVRLKNIALGSAGPGPAKAVWPKAYCRQANGTCTGGIICRVKSIGSHSGNRVLVEKIIMP